jgi:hypothetical protein
MVRSEGAEPVAVRTVEALDEVLDLIDDEARASGTPLSVELTRFAGGGTIALLVGTDAASWSTPSPITTCLVGQASVPGRTASLRRRPARWPGTSWSQESSTDRSAGQRSRDVGALGRRA